MASLRTEFHNPSVVLRVTGGRFMTLFLLTFVTLKWNSRSKILWADEFIFSRRKICASVTLCMWCSIHLVTSEFMGMNDRHHINITSKKKNYAIRYLWRNFQQMRWSSPPVSYHRQKEAIYLIFHSSIQNRIFHVYVAFLSVIQLPLGFYSMTQIDCFLSPSRTRCHCQTDATKIDMRTKQLWRVQATIVLWNSLIKDSTLILTYNQRKLTAKDARQRKSYCIE